MNINNYERFHWIRSFCNTTFNPDFNGRMMSELSLPDGSEFNWNDPLVETLLSFLIETEKAKELKVEELFSYIVIHFGRMWSNVNPDKYEFIDRLITEYGTESGAKNLDALLKFVTGVGLDEYYANQHHSHEIDEEDRNRTSQDLFSIEVTIQISERKVPGVDFYNHVKEISGRRSFTSSSLNSVFLNLERHMQIVWDKCLADTPEDSYVRYTFKPVVILQNDRHMISIPVTTADRKDGLTSMEERAYPQFRNIKFIDNRLAVKTRVYNAFTDKMTNRVDGEDLSERLGI